MNLQEDFNKKEKSWQLRSLLPGKKILIIKIRIQSPRKCCMHMVTSAWLLKAGQKAEAVDHVKNTYVTQIRSDTYGTLTGVSTCQTGKDSAPPPTPRGENCPTGKGQRGTEKEESIKKY